MNTDNSLIVFNIIFNIFLVHTIHICQGFELFVSYFGLKKGFMSIFIVF